MLTGIIDVGSNTIRLSVFKHSANGSFEPVVSRKIVAGLAGYEEGDMLSAQGEAKLCKCLKEFQGILKALDVPHVRAFATASLRRVSNAEQVKAQVYEKTGIKLELISGAEEARLSFIGSQCSTPIDEGLVADIGGGSTELVKVVNGRVGELCSTHAGCLSLSLQIGGSILPTNQEIKKMKAAIDEHLAPAASLLSTPFSTFSFVGGTARATYRIARELKPRTARTLEASEITSIIEGLASRDKEIIRAVRSAAPERIFTLVAGMLIMQTVIGESQPKTLLVSKCGVREGYLIENVIKC
ncbi:MAG: hypothetical protein FWD27_06550 [Coriobacteriia bacterium]|nr:hypothetical protein [Coriobacteriia bacterium]